MGSEPTRSGGRRRDSRDAAFLQAGQTLDVTITDIAYGGLGVARCEGLVVFVRNAVPGDHLRVRVISRKTAHAVAEIIGPIELSASRVAPRCDHFGVCGGCQLMSMAYADQLAHKQRQVAESLSRLGRLEGFTLHPIEPSPAVFEYRNKMEFTFAEGPGGLTAGLRRADDPSAVEEIRHCHLLPPLASEILRWSVRACREAGLGAEHRNPAGGSERTPERDDVPRVRSRLRPRPRARSTAAEDRAALRRLILRRSDRRDRWLVSFETGRGTFAEGPAIARRLMSEFPEVTGVLHVTVPEAKPSARSRPLAGVETLEEEFAGLSLTVTAGAFLQVNSEQATRLYRRIEALARPRARDRLLDLYCGVGAITLHLGRHVGEAVGVELSAESIACARRNASANELARCRFLQGDAGALAARLASQGERFDLVIANPPRAGLPGRVVEAVARLAPDRLIYVSCDPATLARDLARFAHLAYRTTDVAPFDLFPHTYHIESIALLQRDR